MSIELNTLVAPPQTTGTVPPPNEQRLMKTATRLLVVVGCIILVLVAVGIWSRASAAHHLEKTTVGSLATKVVAVHPLQANSVDDLVLPASVQAYTEAPIYARTQGYLKKWYFDIGSRVKRGDLLAEIETPEGDQQLLQARADLKVAQANSQLAGSTAERWKSLLVKNAVSKQETDQAISDYVAKQAAVDAAMANVARLEQLQSYEKVYAPFDGIVTARETDIGALISGDSSPKELFHLASVDKLRVFSSVPETSAGAIKAGADATLTADQFPGRVFHGKISRDSGSIDTRTLNVEVDIDNTSGELLPGAYGFIHLAMPARNAPLTIPANSLVFRSAGLQAALVRDGHAVLIPITIGRDFGDTVEVTTGIAKNDLVIVDPSDSLVSGALVELEKGT